MIKEVRTLEMLTSRALEIWGVIQAHETPYDWKVGSKARVKLDAILGRPAPCWNGGDAAKINQDLRSFLATTLSDAATGRAKAAQLYGWIVADWGGVRRNRQDVEAWAALENGWHGDYGDEVLLAYADRVGTKRISSWSKVFAFAAPDRHAIYDSRVAVALNLALEQLGEAERFFMPASRVVKGANGVWRPNAVARARARLRGHEVLGYRDYLSWLGALRLAAKVDGLLLDNLQIESALFAIAPAMAAAMEPEGQDRRL